MRKNYNSSPGYSFSTGIWPDIDIKSRIEVDTGLVPETFEIGDSDVAYFHD